jgi:L-threonylcarbamoyladenylate synthase
MKSKVIKIFRPLPQWDAISLAAETILNGGIVAFPTDTTYGLAASIYCEKAIERLRRIKSRPGGEPFVILASDTDWVRELAADFSARHKRLMDTYWPGPLTIVFKGSRRVPPHLLGRGGTVALRIPDDTLTQSILRASGVPLAAPSANLRGGRPALRARDVVRDFSGKIDLILDGGQVEDATPSTIVRVGERGLSVLRQGRLALGKVRA